MKMNPNSPLALACTAISLALLSALALLLPDDAISRYALLRDYTTLCRTFIPGIDRLARVSSFPEVTTVVVSVMWTLVPFLTAIYFLRTRIPIEFWQRVRRNRFYFAFSIIVVVVSIGLIVVIYDVEPNDLEGGLLNERILYGVSTSRLGLGLVAGLFLSAIAPLLCMVLMWLTNIRHIYFEQRGGNRL